MAHGRVSVVLGVQEGLGSIIQFCTEQGQAPKSSAVVNPTVFAGRTPLNAAQVPPKNRYTEAEMASIVQNLIQFDRLLRKEEIAVQWGLMGGNPFLELPLLAKHLSCALESKDILSGDDLSGLDMDALIYVPLDVLQSKQVEQLARLSMMAPRVRHVALAPVPRWNHAQLMALREIWQWMDPRQVNKVHLFAEEIIRVNGGLTRRDLAKAGLEKFAAKEEIVEPVIITRSPRMREVLSLVDAVADTDSTILITGDSGTGKELIAQRVHIKSHRRAMPIVAVNCGAIPGELLESELFGHVKGAFTGAVSNREGRFDAAEQGSLFLDEIGEMGANLQVKLLRVLQTRKYEPVGATKTKNADVRIIAATNRDLEMEVTEGRFREDLFYRLNVIPIHVPSLRDRKEDVQLLVEYFIKKFNSEKGRRVTGVTRASLRALVAYDWPGNVRELENLMERMVILKSSGMIDVLDFPEKYRRHSLSEIEYDDLMNSSKGSVTGTANPMLGLTQSTVHGSAYENGSAHQPSLMSIISSEDEIMGEEGMNNFNGNNGGTFSKGIISQSASGVSEVTSGVDGSPVSSEARIEIEGALTIEQVIRLVADKLVFPVEGLDFNSIVDQFENILILQALERTGWNRNRAAGLLRLNRTTLVEKLKKKQLMPPLRFEENFMGGNA